MAELDLMNAGGVARIVFNRPERKNALTFEMVRNLQAHIAEVAADPEIVVLLMRGAGADFSAGGDVGDMSAMLADTPEERARFIDGNLRELSIPLTLALAKLKIPVVASVRGHAIGGGLQLALSADLVIASETARFSAPQVKLGQTADNGQSHLLPHRAGFAAAMQMLLLGEAIDARQAERFGLVNWVVADGELDARTEDLVDRLAAGSRAAIQETKALVLGAFGRDLSAQLEAERAATVRCAADPDFAEALRAFAERRKPNFGQPRP